MKCAVEFPLISGEGGHFIAHLFANIFAFLFDEFGCPRFVIALKQLRDIAPSSQHQLVAATWVLCQEPTGVIHLASVGYVYIVSLIQLT